MIYLLDSNACIHTMRAKGNSLVKHRVAAQSRADVVLCAVVEAELLAGAEGSQNPVAAVTTTETFIAGFVSISFDSGSARHYSRIMAHLKRIGLPIGLNDMMIAAIALQHDLTVVTHNTSEFARVPGLKIVDWEIP